MRPQDLKSERLRRGWGQLEAARHLGMSQPYLAMLEQGKRRLTSRLMRKVASVYGLPPVKLPVSKTFTPVRRADPQRLTEYLARLEYPGFAYVHSRVKARNPSEVLLTALSQESLEARLAEALPWLLLRYWQTDFGWLVENAKRFDLQNRLGFVVNLARHLSERTGEATRTNALAKLEMTLDQSRLVREGFFPRPPRNNAERQWLKHNRPKEARHWNLLSDLQPEHLQYAE